jgi:hypothetical protein
MRTYTGKSSVGKSPAKRYFDTDLYVMHNVTSAWGETGYVKVLSELK